MSLGEDFGVRRFRELLLMATCGMAAEFLLALADTVIAGHIVGETALAGINLLQPVFNLVQFTAGLIGMGTAIRFSLETGRLDLRRAREMFSQGLWSILLFGSLLFVLFVVGRETVLGFYGASDAITTAARDYWRWYAPCTLLLPVTLYLITLVYADGDLTSCALGYAALIGGNVVVSYFLCLRMGVAGCALGTVIGNFMAIIALSGHFFRKANTLHLARYFRFADMWLICKSSFADASISLCWSLLFFLLNNLVVEEFGSEMLSVLSVVLVCINLTLLFNGISSAAQPIVGVYVGERNNGRVRKVMNAAMVTAFAEGLLAVVFFAAFPMAAVKLVGIGDPSHVEVACRAVRIVAIGSVGAAFVMLFNSYYLFIERFALAFALTFFADIVVYAVVCPPCAHFLGINGLWWSLGLSPLIAVALFSVFVCLRYGRDMFPLLLSRVRESRQSSYGFKVGVDGNRAAEDFVSSALSGVVDQSLSERVRNAVGAVFSRVMENNPVGEVHAEVCVDCNDGIGIVLRYDGVLVDVAEAATDCRGTYCVTTGYNRIVFKV